ncbi:MAG: TonB family protein [Proteobacteria bacterium]|nr:TonB family protein [Pseudomonadota bacterium]
MRFNRGAASKLMFKPAKPMAVALAGSLVAHLMLLTIQGAQNTPHSRLASADLDVVLVNSQSMRHVNVADVLAQVSLQGGGNTDAETMATTSAPVDYMNTLERSVKLAGRQVEQLERSIKQLLVLNRDQASLRLDSERAEPKQQNSVNSKILMDVVDATSMNRLQAKIDKEWSNYQKRPKRKFIGANVAEADFASYVERWRQQIEDLGSRLYSHDLSDAQLEGVMIVTVSIRSDGTVEHVVIDRSSGSKKLDKTATDIVQRSAPFDRFDSKLSAQFDVLSITRQWSFTKNDLDLK